MSSRSQLAYVAPRGRSGQTALLNYTLTILIAWLILPGMGAVDTKRVRLDIENPCWLYELEDPVLLCTVRSMDYAILWRRDWSLIAYSGNPIDDGSRWYNMYSRITRNATLRQERLQLSSSEMVDVVIKQGSQFVCENQGYQSSPITLYEPECRHCGSCTSMASPTFGDINEPKGGINSKASGLKLQNKHDDMRASSDSPPRMIGTWILLSVCCVIAVLSMVS